MVADMVCSHWVWCVVGGAIRGVLEHDYELTVKMAVLAWTWT